MIMQDFPQINLLDISLMNNLILNNDKPKATVITFGCQQNEADSEKIRGMAVSMGYELTEKPENADLIVLNTCAIREHAEMKVLSMLGRFKDFKEHRPNLIIGVVGCMAAEEHVVSRLKSQFKYVSFTLEPSMLDMFPQLVCAYRDFGERKFIYNCDDGRIVEGIPAIRASKHKAWVSVMYGCNNFCSYCIVPYTRSRERSRCSVDIINECKALIKDGYKEITLLGQNVNSYRSDISFAELISSIAELEGDFIVRFMTSHPKDASDELIAAIASHPKKIAPHFHLPLQSGSNSILKKMNRTYNRERYLDLASKIKEAVPGIALTTDIIIGFPGETEEDFERTLDILREVKFDMVYSFLYSPRKGTPAAKMAEQIPEAVKKERMNRLLDLQNRISLEKNEEYLNREVTVFVEGQSKGKDASVMNARTASNKLVHLVCPEDCIGKFIKVKITKACAFDLYAELI